MFVLMRQPISKASWLNRKIALKVSLKGELQRDIKWMLCPLPVMAIEVQMGVFNIPFSTTSFVFPF